MDREGVRGELIHIPGWGSQEVIQFFKFCGTLQRFSDVTWAYYSSLNEYISDLANSEESIAGLNLYLNGFPLVVEDWPDVDGDNIGQHIGLRKVNPYTGEAQENSALWLAKIDQGKVLTKNHFFIDEQIDMLMAQKAEQRRMRLPSLVEK